MPKLMKIRNYEALLRIVRKEIAHGQEVIERQQAITYWNVGRYIDAFILQGKGRAGYGQEIYQKLSRDMGIHTDTLERAVRFSREFSISDARRKLSWTHYKILLGVNDPAKRKQLEARISKKNLTTRQLQDEVNRYKASKKQALPVKEIPAKTERVVLECVRGKLHTYRIIKLPEHLNFGHELMVDCGFNVHKPVSTKLGLRDGQVVETVKPPGPRAAGLRKYKVVKSKAGAKGLYTYKAHLQRVVDGDTLWAMIDAGFKTYIRLKLRFYGINAFEMSDPRGPEAKRFVEKALQPLDFFVIKTHKNRVGKWARYLADVFYLPGESEPDVVAKSGRFLNQELLDEGLAEKY